ncbi:MAG: hypothetical protein AWU54_2125 [Candidatus Frackibacter sp. T328-2]|nr:MAG: hypothetical protein AWU54_2125 [Candidatus Frackibacter sp. T328-2]
MIAIELIKNVPYFIYKLFLILIMFEYILVKVKFINQVLNTPGMIEEKVVENLVKEYFMKIIGGILILRFLLIKL